MTISGGIVLSIIASCFPLESVFYEGKKYTLKESNVLTHIETKINIKEIKVKKKINKSHLLSLYDVKEREREKKENLSL